MTSMAVPPNNPVTQIFYLTIPKEKDLRIDKAWLDAIEVLTNSSGFQRCYWGRSLESPGDVQLHVVRDNLDKCKTYLSSPNHTKLISTLQPLTSTSTPPLIRHATLHALTNPSPLKHPFPPFAGSAIYVQTTPTWHEGSWPLWTHIVRYVKGCVGIAGGSVIEEVDGCKDCYLVYVGWESVEAHEAYHHTQHFEKRKVVLGLGNSGYREYGHVVFDGAREGREVAKL